MRHIRLALSLATLGAFASSFSGCSSDKRPPPEDIGTEHPSDGNGGSGQGGSASDDAGTGQGGTESAPQSCATKQCRGPATCVETDGVGQCVCDEGYENVADECVVDEDCIKLRLIEPECRQFRDAQPAVAMLFDVATCAGTTVKPAVLGNIDSAFAVRENGTKLGSESYATVFERDVESYVVIAVDLSTSVTEERSADVPALRDHIKALVRDLEPGVGESPVYVELIPFGRSANVAMPFSSDFDAISDRIDDIFENTGLYVPEPNGTNLNGAINQGTLDLQDTLAFRTERTGGGVVATGTVLSITDGNDNSGVRLEARAERYNLISVGISGDVNNQELTRIGAQGSFLAPSPADWQASFENVARRVAEYPRRSYLLGYCSPASAGRQTISVTWANGTAESDATCQVDAADFGTGQACNGEFIANYCTSSVPVCAGFLACGACSTDGGNPESDWDFGN